MIKRTENKRDLKKLYKESRALFYINIELVAIQ